MLGTLSHLRIITPLPSGSKAFGPRKHNAQWGFICPTSPMMKCRDSDHLSIVCNVSFNIQWKITNNEALLKNQVEGLGKYGIITIY